jgi:hypothetical protein
MANFLKINPATDGSNDSKAMEQVACVPLDYQGNDITLDNPLPVASSESPLNSAIKSTAVTVTTSATQIPATALTSRKSVSIYNNSSETVYLGDSGVTVAQGSPLKQDASIEIDLGPDLVVYGIVNSGTADVRIAELS